ncbi:BTB/POZ domain-containing protein 19 isoform X2 [Artibeus jamaicensis]|uniref:BTB/POZ domain-containing protein 19 isoform X2 n=1 Tax=Artibeus jamaicensis TaxID=9417 RepID=UPI00235A4F69|nr:BTB/POZ domain-containing protein 19 isoform X2 [Artibeus jamaicensis]
MGERPEIQRQKVTCPRYYRMELGLQPRLACPRPLAGRTKPCLLYDKQGNKGPEWANAKCRVAPWTLASPWLSALLSHSDVRFVVGQERQEVFAHRCLLACRCNFFQRLLGPEPSPGVPSPVVLSTVPAEAFLAVLEFLYTNTVKLHRHSVLEVLTAAVEYGLEELREICLEFVVKVLDVELVCEALQVAVTFGLGPLQERCIAFIEAHSQEALRTRGFLELSASALLPLLRSDKLCVDEADLILAARSWARVGAAVLERPVAEVAAPIVRELRLALLAPAELSALEEQNRREPLIPVRTRGSKLRSTQQHGGKVEQIVEAWKCHAMRRGNAARGASCRRRRGTLPRDHHRFLDLPFK